VDIATLLGVGGAFAALGLAVFFTGGSVITYIDIPSFMEVIIGSYFAMMVSTSLSNALGIFGTMARTMRVPHFDMVGIIQKLMSFADKSRREGILSLEEEIVDLDNEFMKKGLRLVVDGTDGEIIQDLLGIEINKMQERHAKKIAVLYQWATVAPAVGMLGTVIGLVAMMKNLSDKDSVGPNMAMALITTLYGAIVAHFFCTPMAVKLKSQDADEAACMEMIIEGVLSIQAGDNPRVSAVKLLSYLPPNERRTLEAELLKD
jgi:chemotaxis protein MotA